MTIDETTASAYGTVRGYDDAVSDARKAADGGRVDDFLERIAERVGGTANVRAVFGDPIERGGVTVIPVAKVRWGFGGGSGTGPVAVGPGNPGTPPFSDAVDASGTTTDSATRSTGAGGGGGVTADPIGWLEIGPDGATFQAIASPMPSPGFLLAAGTTAALVLRSVAKLVRR
jgi:uncharacterized spore protein YtfJ